MAPLLDIRGLRAGYAGVPVLQGIDLALEQGSFGVILGSITREQTSALREVIARFSGTIAFTSGDALEYEPPSAGQRQLLQRLKLAFDPDNRLAPLPWVK